MTRREVRQLSLIMTCGVAMASLQWAQDRSSDHHRQAKAVEGADRVVVLRDATPEAAVPSRPAELAGRAKSRRRCQSWSLKLANRPCTSISG
jgi:hypothetical protein